MPKPFTSLLRGVCAGESLDREAMRDAIDHIMSGEADEGAMALFLTALAAKGETAEEVAGAAAAMREHMTPIRHRHARLLDTCGTGGGGSELFNISTTAALVIAASGVPVAKHGNRSVTSRSGSADVLAELGVNIEADIPQVERCLDELGVCFCFAQRMHPSMRHVAAVRKKLGIRTIFNILGPLSNPASASHLLLGAGRPELRPLIASSLRLLGVQRAMVVSGSDGLGEVTLAGPSSATMIDRGGEWELTLKPADFGLETSPLDSLRVAGPAESASKVRSVLAGSRGPAREIVILNAAAGLMTVDERALPQDSAARAATAIDSGAAANLLERLAELSHRP
jgi:anthranilate phosphoribosyltransferase